MLKKQKSIFRNQPRSLNAEDAKKIVGGGPGDLGEEPPMFGKKDPYDMDYATRTFN